MLPQKETGGGKPLQKLLFRRLRTLSRRSQRGPCVRRCRLYATGCPSGVACRRSSKRRGPANAPGGCGCWTRRAGHASVGAAQRKRSLVDSAMRSRALPNRLCAHTGRATRGRLPSARSRADRAHSPSCTSLPSRRAMRSRSSLDVNAISMVPRFSVPWMFTVVPKRLPRRWDRADAAQ